VCKPYNNYDSHNLDFDEHYDSHDLDVDEHNLNDAAACVPRD
jgi:hypothetical protein